jgi:GrpB-like predicted nucleotidyltransferase (UPF0157 family)
MWICHPTLEVGHMAFPDEVARNPGSALTDPLQELVAIGPYEQLPATCNDHDPRSFEVAKRVADLIESHLPDVRVEHVGSTAVPGCASKGVVDLMILYPPGQLPEVREGLDALGFQRQTGRNPFPEERPLRLGSIEFDSTRFRLHAHVIAVDSPEVLELRTFRDRLRGEPLLLERYVALKRKGCDRASAKDFHEIRAVFTRGVA